MGAIGSRVPRDKARLQGFMAEVLLADILTEVTGRLQTSQQQTDELVHTVYKPEGEERAAAGKGCAECSAARVGNHKSICIYNRTR